MPYTNANKATSQMVKPLYSHYPLPLANFPPCALELCPQQRLELSHSSSLLYFFLSFFLSGFHQPPKKKKKKKKKKDFGQKSIPLFVSFHDSTIASVVDLILEMEYSVFERIG